LKTKTLDPQTLEIIKQQVVPKARSNDEMIMLADWESIIETAIYLGIDVKAEISRVNTAASIVNPNFAGIKLLSLDRRREVLTTLDRHLGTTHLQDFEKRLDRLNKILNAE
jgi:hypothetical protein